MTEARTPCPYCRSWPWSDPGQCCKAGQLAAEVERLTTERDMLLRALEIAGAEMGADVSGLPCGFHVAQWCEAARAHQALGGSPPV